MNTNYSENNHLVLVGKVVSEKSYSHEIYGEKFYVFNLEVVRLSSTVDIIPNPITIFKSRKIPLERVAPETTATWSSDINANGIRYAINPLLLIFF